MSRALANSPRMAEFRARTEEANYALEEALAPGRPQLDLNASYTRQDPSVNLPLLNLTVQPEHNYVVGLRARQIVADFGRIHWAARSAQNRRTARELEAEEESLALAQETALSYLESLLAQRSLQVAQDDLRSREEQMRVTKSRFESGAVARFDTIRSQAELASAKKRVLEAENRVRLARAALESLAGGPLEPTEINALPSPPGSLEDGIGSALQRPLLEAMRAEHEAAQSAVRVAESSDNPRLAFQTDYLRRNATGFYPDHQWSVSLQLEIPLFDGGLSAARTGQAGSRVTQLEARLQEAERTTRLQAESAYLDLQSKWLQLEVAEDKRKQAEEARRLSVLRYKYGLATHLELLDSETVFSQAKVEIYRARYEYAGSWVAWGRVTNRLGEVLEYLSVPEGTRSEEEL